MNNWLITQYEQVQLYDGFRIVFTTDIPVHLFCWWTAYPPWVHRVAGIVRGLSQLLYSYFCFVVSTKLEQLEPGDTLEHTFDIEGWEYCRTRWFVFAGTVGGEKAPSVSPIFKKHNNQPTITPGFFATPTYHCVINDQLNWVNCDRATEGLFSDLLPSNAEVAFLHFKNIGSRFYVGLRPTGSAFNRTDNMTGNSHLWGFVKLDNQNSFDIIVQNTFNVSCDLIGYATKEAVIMFDEPLDRTTPAGDAWQTVDLALDCPDALGIFSQFSRNIDINSLGFRPYGSTQNRLASSVVFWYLFGCSADQKTQYYPDEKPSRVANLYILGYVKNSASFLIASQDKSLTITGSYQPITTSPLTSLAFLEAYAPPVTAKIACRPVGSAEDIYMNPSYRRCFVVARLNASGRFEYKIEHLDSDLYLLGTGT